MKVGIIGRTGAGKTTLLKLMLRQLDPTSGRVLVDGRDARGIRLREFRSQFAVMTQEPMLFSCSVGENIAYGRPGATPEKIETAARSAGAHEFIERLPAGYDARLGERGASLSGVERQRIALARAFLKDAPFLVLDEPTSAVDAETEGAIMESLSRLMEGRTTIMIAHRLTTLSGSDMIIRVENGAISLETGKSTDYSA